MKTMLTIATRAFVVVTSLLVGCATTPEPDQVAGPFVPPSGQFSLAIPSWLVPLGPDGTFDVVYQNRENTIFAGVIVDRPARDLDELEVVIERNLKSAGYEGARVIDVSDAMMGGLPARRSTMRLEAGARSFLMVNTYAATAHENVQLIVWGLSSVSHLVRDVANEISQTGIQFADTVVPLIGVDRHRLDDERLPIRFRRIPTQWMPTAKHELVSDEVMMEMKHEAGGFFFVGFRDDVALNPDETFAEFESRVLKDIGALFDDGAMKDGPTVPANHAADSRANDREWTLSGVLQDEQVHVTYRVRVVKSGRHLIRLYCWGESGAAQLDEACREVLSIIDVKDR